MIISVLSQPECFPFCYQLKSYLWANTLPHLINNFISLSGTWLVCLQSYLQALILLLLVFLVFNRKNTQLQVSQHLVSDYTQTHSCALLIFDEVVKIILEKKNPAYLINGAGKTEWPLLEEQSYISTSHHVQESIQSGSNLN